MIEIFITIGVGFLIMFYGGVMAGRMMERIKNNGYEDLYLKKLKQYRDDFEPVIEKTQTELKLKNDIFLNYNHVKQLNPHQIQDHKQDQ